MIVYIYPISLFPDLHSDKIFGAILSTLNDLFPSITDTVIKRFKQNNPPFLISSAFPFININNKKIRFYPKILLNDESDFNGDLEIIKNFDDVKFLQEEIFFDIINGNLSFNQILNNYGNYFQVDEFLLNQNIDIQELKNFSKRMIVSQNSINRLNNFFKVFYSEGIKYNDVHGLFFHISFFDEGFIEIFKAVLRLLKDRGFGSKISIGRGQFSYELENDDVYKNHNSKFSINNNYFVTLSRFIPTSDDLKFIDLNSNYELYFKRGIDRFGDFRKQAIFFSEGSTFLGNENNFFGKLFDSSENSVEYGFAFNLKINVIK
ncbi:type III-A CRISPR-associated RAMP protein Csm4 [uncultured Methanobrevibacter sp.]|uniref:type III-A CRISPR-associated RAMP protein Csm4 n=1 Tax=uncultured Methanobrevibacter sp. TaxID=253161 RepID=UPI0025D2F341|nr:type III-A CRISPR-associated RAMP protein Csm4 [uncultured Methanobrevibacter sp.]